MKFLMILVLIIFSIIESKFKLRKSKVKSKIRQILGNIYSGEFHSRIGTSSNQYKHENNEAVTFGKAGIYTTIPSDHPLITHPKYVEKLNYYEDQPNKDKEIEAVSINHTDEDYYKPFANKHLIFEAKSVFNCESILSPFVCLESSLCSWDNLINSCCYTHKVVREIRFIEKISEDKNIKIKNKRKVNFNFKRHNRNK